MAERTSVGPPGSALAAGIPRRDTGEQHLTQSAEPPAWMAAPPNDGGLDIRIDMAGAEVTPIMGGLWDDDDEQG